MEPNQFVEKLKKAQELMKKENYKDAKNLIDQLKVIERDGDFDYSLTHQLYQLDSNVSSLLNQTTLLKYLNNVKKTQESITFEELLKLTKNDLNLDLGILQREIELLILRGVITYKIDGNRLIF